MSDETLEAIIKDTRQMTHDLPDYYAIRVRDFDILVERLTATEKRLEEAHSQHHGLAMLKVIKCDLCDYAIATASRYREALEAVKAEWAESHDYIHSNQLEAKVNAALTPITSDCLPKDAPAMEGDVLHKPHDDKRYPHWARSKPPTTTGGKE